MKAIAYFNGDVSEHAVLQAMLRLQAQVAEYSNGYSYLTFNVRSEGPDHGCYHTVRLSDGIAIGVHRPPVPSREPLTCSVNFSKTLAYVDDREHRDLHGVGGPHDCCVRADRVTHGDTVMHEFLHTIQGESINGHLQPSPDNNWWYVYSGYDRDSELNSWENWYRALLTQAWGTRLEHPRVP